MNNSISIQICDKCKSVLPVGKPYYSIGKTLELLSENTITKEPEIEVIEDDQIITLCITCGRHFNIDALETILKHLPIPGQQGRN